MEKNKAGKYLKYAIGEIILVVIGILIALSINNANELRKNENEINSILKQVRSELATSIQESDRIMKNYMKKDSLIYLVKTNKVTYDDYKNKKIEGLTGIAMNFIPLDIQNDGYLNLMTHIKNTPKDLDTILRSLKEVYVQDYKSVEQSNKFVEDANDRFLDWLMHNTTWFSDIYFTKKSLSDEQINFYLKSSYYQNIISEFYNLGLENDYVSVAKFRYHAFNCYKKITHHLNSSEGLTLKPSPVQQKIETYKTYLGTYMSKLDTLKISTKKDEFIIQVLNNPKEYPIITVNSTSFILSLDYFFHMNYDKEGKVFGMTRRIGDDFSEYTKID
jgi:hypothetical protein